MSAVPKSPAASCEPPAEPAAQILLIEQAAGDFARIAALACETPFAALAMRRAELAWCRHTGRTEAAALPDHRCLDDQVLHRGELLEVRDAAADDRFASASDAKAQSALGFYAGVPLLAPDGRAFGVLAVMDVAPRRLDANRRTMLTALAKQAAAQIAICEDLIFARAVAENAPVAIYTTDKFGSLTYANPEYRRTFNLTPDKNIHDWALGVHPDDRARMKKSWAQFCRQPEPVRFEYRTEPHAGAVRFLAEQVVAVDSRDGFIGTIADFTDLVAARSDLLQNQTLLEAVIANLPVGLLACDAAGRITHHNHAADALFGTRVATLRGEAPTDAYGPTARVYLADGTTPVSPTEQPLARALRGETISDLELVIVPSGSAPRATLSNARRLVGPDGRTLGAVLVVQDITERKLADLELERVHKQLLAASRQAGMAEIATNVLHNVGNVLTSVNVSASLLGERINNSKPAGLSRVAALIEDHAADLGAFVSADARGRHLPEYLKQLAGQLQTDQRVALEELASLRGNIEHIRDTVNMQQSYAKLCGVTETVAVAALVEDGLRMNAGALARHRIALHREIGEVSPITVDKHKVLQILVNLIRNAKHACDESGRTDKAVTIRVEGDAHRVRISVVDNGVGIRAENMARLFTHGFTTRASGHGFGLHSGALTARELGGSLSASSDGPGCGASFVLELPCAPRQP